MNSVDSLMDGEVDDNVECGTSVGYLAVGCWLFDDMHKPRRWTAPLRFASA